MAIHYQCRYCGQKLGSLDEKSVHAEQLGFHILSDEERQEMISYDSEGNIHVKSICEDCHESLSKNPIYYEIDHIIH